MSTKILKFQQKYFCFGLILCVCSIIINGGAKENYASNEWTNKSATYDSVRCGRFLEVKTEQKYKRRAKRFRARGDGRVNKIMGGQDVQEGTSPWTAAIFRQKDDGGAAYWCAGTLISKRHVITAAHCMFNGPVNKLCFTASFINADDAKIDEMCKQSQGFMDVEQIRQLMSVYIGSVCLSGQTDPPCVSPKTQREFRVKNLVILDDFIVLELDVDNEIGNAVPAALGNHICMHFMHNLRDDFYWTQTSADNLTLPVQMTGWGSSPNNEQSSKLQVLEMPNIWTHEACALKRGLVEEEEGLGGFSDDKLCTMETRDMDSCRGDSGGGLVGNFEDGTGRRRWFLLGVLSSGTDCLQLRQGLQAPLTQEFTNVSFHTDSISVFLEMGGTIDATATSTTISSENTNAGALHKADADEDEIEEMDFV
uniref:Peptidase S1 domain-containing protein n=1 Tax=Globodera pallida TaxID=36090 RepID=A0A183C2M2_GLOPA